MLKRVFPYIKPYRWYAILSPIMMILEVAMDVLIPTLMAQIVNVGIANQDVPYVIKMGLIMIAMALFGMAAGAFSSFLGATAGYGTAAELRKDLYHSIQDYSFNNIDEISVPSLITRLTSDADTVGQVVMMSTRMAFRAPFMMLGALIASIRMDSELAIMFAVAIPAIIIIAALVFRKATPLFRAMQTKVDNLNGVIQEQLAGIRVIKSFNRKDHSEAKFQERNQDLRDTSISAILLMMAVMPALTLVIYGCITAALWFGGNSIIQGTMLPGNLIAFITYISQVLMSIMMLAVYSFNLMRGKISLERIISAVDLESEIKEKANPVTEVADGSISFEEVCFRYPGYRENILDDINLDIPSGAKVGIIGQTGSSKSTLVHLIPRLYDVDCGSVKVGGVDVRDYELDALRDAIGYVLQKNTLVSGTIRSNMLWGNETASDEEIITALKQAQAWEFVSKYPDTLDHEVEQGGSNFSGGQRQRLTIARALIKQPKILILDDSTSAVDMTTDLKIRQALNKELEGLTSIIIAQRIDSIKDSDLIIVLDEGAIETKGNHDYLLEHSPIYRDIATSQEGGLDQ